MRIPDDWKWYAALAVFVLFTAIVVYLPRPHAKSMDISAPPASSASPATSTPVRPDPTPAEHDDMLQYTVQEGDTAAGIAGLFVVSEDELRRVNHIPDGNDFTHGDKIWIPAQ